MQFVVKGCMLSFFFKKMLLLFWRLFVFDLFFLIAMCHSDNSVILQQEQRGKEMQIDDIMRSEEVMR